MNLKNYTSEVPAVTSMSRIETALVQTGASDISKKYENQVCVAIRFRMLVNGVPMFFELPARVENCYKVMYAEIKKPRPDTKEKVRKQAERTAWKIISDWVLVQLSMIMLEQAEPMQIFLPYAWDPATEKTFYDKLKENGFKQLTR